MERNCARMMEVRIADSTEAVWGILLTCLVILVSNTPYYPIKHFMYWGTYVHTVWGERV